MAESTDRIHFTRPEIGLYEFDGSRKNNIVWDNSALCYYDANAFIQ
jgi:hypothetical protein